MWFGHFSLPLCQQFGYHNVLGGHTEALLKSKEASCRALAMSILLVVLLQSVGLCRCIKHIVPEVKHTGCSQPSPVLCA